MENTNRFSPTEVDALLFEIWREVLGREQIDHRENFFELGGDSIQGLIALSQVQNLFGLDLPLALIFDFSNFGDLNKAIVEMYASNCLPPHD